MSKTVNELMYILLDLPQDSRIDFVVKDGRDNVVDTNDFDLNTSSKETYIEFILETNKVSELKDKINELENNIDDLKDKVEELENDINKKDSEIYDLKQEIYYKQMTLGEI